VLFFDLRVIGNNVLVTVKTFFNRRDSWEVGAADIGVTKFALDLLHACVNPVTERDRLFRAKTFDRHDVKKIEAQHDDCRTAEDHQNGPLVSQNGIQGNYYFTSRCLTGISSGKRASANRKVMAIRARKPKVISTSAMLMGMECAFGFKAGLRSR